MLYPARWKRITVDQSKVLKIDFRFLGATRYTSKSLITTSQMSLFHLLCGPLSNWLDFKKFRDISGLWFPFSLFYKASEIENHICTKPLYKVWQYAVKVRRHMPWSRVRCHGSHECWFTHRQFHSQFHSRRHSLRTTLKYTTLVCMRSTNAWTTKPWQRS